MLNKQVGRNFFKVKGTVYEVIESGYLVLVNNTEVKVMSDQKGFEPGACVYLEGHYSFQDKSGVIYANKLEASDTPSSAIDGEIEGEIREVRRKGTQKSPWVIVYIIAKYTEGENNVTSSQIKVTLSSSSLKTVSYDLEKGDRIGLKVHNTDLKELTLKANKVTLHYPKEVIEYFNSTRFLLDRHGA